MCIKLINECKTKQNTNEKKEKKLIIHLENF